MGMDLYLAGGGNYTPGPMSIGETVVLATIALLYLALTVVIVRSDRNRR